MNKTSIGFLSALSLLGGTIVLRVNDVITDQMIFWTVVVILIAVVSLLMSFAATEKYKRDNFTQDQIDCINTIHSDKCDVEKRQVNNYAVMSARCSMFICGVIFIVLNFSDWRHVVATVVFWAVASFLIGYLSPILWRVITGYLKRRKVARAAQ